MPAETTTHEGMGVESRRPVWLCYGLGILAVAAVTAVRLLGWSVLHDDIPWIMFAPVIMVAAWFGGWGPGLLATLLSTVAVDYFLLPPYGALKIVNASQATGVIVFVVTGVFIGGLADWARGARARLEETAWELQDANESLAAANEELQSQSEELAANNEELRVQSEELEQAWQETKQTTEALSESEARLRTIVENLAEGLVVSDMDGNLLHWNPAALEMHGFASQEEGQRALPAFAQIFELSEMDGTLLPLERWPLARVLRGEELRDWDVRVRRLAGEWARIFSYGGSLVRDADGRTLMAVLTINDVTERKRAEEEIRELNEDLEERVRERTADLEAANKELEAFSYSVSHDLRAPLRSIDGFSKILLERYAGTVDARGQDYLARVRAATQRMGQLIDDILRLSRATRAEMRPAPVNLSTLAADVMAELRQTDPLRQAEIAITPGMVADGDPQLLRIVLQNLLGNAWKFTRNREAARIDFSVNTQDAERVYCICDNGAGFDPAHAGKLFAPFQRLHSEAEFPGTGIGLALVQRIIRRHGGRIWAEGVVDQGATFCFTLGEESK